MVAVTNSAKPIRITLIDDHEMIREGLQMLIESSPNLKLVGMAGNSCEAVASVEREQPDVIILDLVLDGESGLAIIPQLLEKAKRARVLVLTGVLDQEAHREALRLGARGLVLKDKAADVLLKAIDRVHAGEVWFDRSIMSSALSDALKQKVARQVEPEAAKIAELTEREHQVIALVCEGLKNKQIAERLFISDSTVRHHLTSIFSKLEISDRLELVIYAYKHGLAKPPR